MQILPVLLSLFVATTALPTRQLTDSSPSPPPSPPASPPYPPGHGPVELGTAANFAILSKAGITTVPTSAITGDIGVSPITFASMTGFALVLHSSAAYATSTQVVGKVYAADYGVPTPAKMTTAVGDSETRGVRTPAFRPGARRPAPLS